jgi:hypothetical protein
MIFSALPVNTQLIVLKDFIKFNSEIKNKYYTIEQALEILNNDDVIEYDILDGNILL